MPIKLNKKTAVGTHAERLQALLRKLPMDEALTGAEVQEKIGVSASRLAGLGRELKCSIVIFNPDAGRQCRVYINPAAYSKHAPQS